MIVSDRVTFQALVARLATGAYRRAALVARVA